MDPKLQRVLADECTAKELECVLASRYCSSMDLRWCAVSLGFYVEINIIKTKHLLFPWCFVILRDDAKFFFRLGDRYSQVWSFHSEGIDLWGPLLASFERRFGAKRSGKAGRRQTVSDDYMTIVARLSDPRLFLLWTTQLLNVFLESTDGDKCLGEFSLTDFQTFAGWYIVATCCYIVRLQHISRYLKYMLSLEAPCPGEGHWVHSKGGWWRFLCQVA